MVTKVHRVSHSPDGVQGVNSVNERRYKDPVKLLALGSDAAILNSTTAPAAATTNHLDFAVPV